MTTIRIALVGQPNVGKSYLINAVGGAQLRVGNFSGVTVAKKTISFSRQGFDFEVTDLPGSYSLTDYTIEERVTKQHIDHGNYDLLLNVVDSTNIERNLFLTLQLLARNSKMVVALNMQDEAEREGITIDAAQLGKILGTTCVETSAVKHHGIEELLSALVAEYQAAPRPMRLLFSETYESELDNICEQLRQNGIADDEHLKPTAIQLLRADADALAFQRSESGWLELEQSLNNAQHHLQLHTDLTDTDDIFQEEIHALAKGAVTETVRFAKLDRVSRTERLDAILTHSLFGLPIFFFLIWGLFQITFELGSIPMDWIDAFFGLLIDGTKSFLGNTEFASMIADGAIAGVGAVVLFLPNIVLLFTGIALLESTGYMARAAFLLDGFFHKFGLHGKSFVPLVSGFGCSVPAYMAARTLKNDRDRLLTLYITGFMSCGAKLPVYVLLVGAFVPEQHAGNALFGIYVFGALLGTLAAKLLKALVFKGQDEPFVMEMPRYRLPTLKLLYHTVMEKALLYLHKAGTFILAASVLIWIASNYPKHPEIQADYAERIAQVSHNETQVQALENKLLLVELEQSYLGQLGHASEPFFRPLGFDWRMAVALETGLAAKEIVVATMGVLYGLGGEHDEASGSLIDKMRANIAPPAALSFLIFVMVYFPCLAASMVFRREAGGWHHWGYLFVFTTGTAWVLAFATYRIASVLLI